MTAPRPRARRGTRFPLVEVFGYPWDSEAPTAKSDWARQWCPFADRECEKFIQYGYGYCSVTYAAEWDEEWQTYAVCDHRLDGEPLRAVMLDHFKTIEGVHLVPEVTMRSSPKLNVDYVAFREDPSFADGVDLIAIETQAIDLRGGGVGPAFMAWREGNQREWRQYFTDEARAKGRRDSVDYGVNTGNVYKRLGTQVADKGV